MPRVFQGLPSLPRQAEFMLFLVTAGQEQEFWLPSRPLLIPSKQAGGEVVHYCSTSGSTDRGFEGGLIAVGSWWKPWSSTRPHLMAPQQEGKRSLFLPGGGRNPVSIHGLYWHWEERDGHCCLTGIKILSPYSAFSHTTLAAVFEHLSTAQGRAEV